MPEGDTIFRTARALGRALVGKPVTGFRSTYPLLTRFNDDTPITGQLVDRVEARGKWLLIHFSGGATLATHMLMSGSWHIYRHGERWQQPRFNMRIVLENSDYIAVGFRVPVAEMHTAQSLARDRRIPHPEIDVLSPSFDAAEIALRIQAHGNEEIADVLLHQEVMAGVGNVFKSEICFVTGINPFCKVCALTDDQIQSLDRRRAKTCPRQRARRFRRHHRHLWRPQAPHHARVRSRRQPLGLWPQRRARAAAAASRSAAASRARTRASPSGASAASPCPTVQRLTGRNLLP